jgi:putative ABC transport system permease protein
MRELWAKFRAALGGRRAMSGDLDEELKAHLEFEIEENHSSGMTLDAARQAAQREFGSKTLIKENAWNAWGFPGVENFLNDIAYGARVLRKAPVFAAAAVLTLGLGIGANTAIFTVIRAVLLKPLAYQEPDRLVRISVDNARQNYQDVGFTLPRYQEMQAAAKSFSEFTAFFIATEHMTLSGGDEPEQIVAARVSANFLHILGMKALLGRGFLPEEDKTGARSVALVSAEMWSRRFGRDPMVTSKTITINATPYTIIGVLPEGFVFPAAGVDVWVTRPAEFSEIAPQFWDRLTVLIGLARLKPHVTIEQARGELSVLNRQYIRAHPGNADAAPGVSIRAVFLRDQLVEKVRSMLWVLFGAVGCVLLIACANVASLLLARAASRSREFAVRAALGAGRNRLIRQLLAESLLLALAGGVFGVLLAKWILQAITQVKAFPLPRAGEIHLDATVLAFTIVVSLATGVLFGIVPSFQASRPALSSLLRERTGEGALRRTAFGVSTRSLLVIGQVALSVMLLIGAALLMESFVRLHNVNTGFQPVHLLTMRIDLPPARYDTPPKKEAFFRELIRRVEAIPGVRSAAAALTLPMSPRHAVAMQVVEQAAVKLSDRPSVQLQSVTPGYFRTAGIPLRRGREFASHDNTDRAPLALLINESMARRFWPNYPGGQNPIGQHVLIGDNTANAFEVVGIAADVHERGFPGEVIPELYLSYHFYSLQTAGLLVRTQGDPQGVIRSIRKEMLEIDRDQPIAAVQMMDELLESSVGQQRLTLWLLSSFAAVALLLAAIGIYGLIAYSVVQRTQELGIRRALGAQAGDILQLVVGHGMRLTVIGILIGLTGAFAATRAMSGLLFHVSATDPGVFLSVALVFVLVSLVASYIPAWRATRVDPMTALR